MTTEAIGILEKMSPTEWEHFCENMLRRHYGQRDFWPVPDKDRGDLGIEFFTSDGTIFQCYYPDTDINISDYKKRVKKKINEDLKKLNDNEADIAKLLDGIQINQWILLVPANKSRELIPYCNKKKREVIGQNISYIDNQRFLVKIETADTYPAARNYAIGVYNNIIDIPIQQVSETEKKTWIMGNSPFHSNIERKASLIMGDSSAQFRETVITKYIQIEKFLDRLRQDHPDLYNRVDDNAVGLLEMMKADALFTNPLNDRFIKELLDKNRTAFNRFSEFLSEANKESLSFGYLSKWLAECYMDFK